MIKKFLSLIFTIAFFNFGTCQMTFGREVMLESGTKIRLKLADKISSGLNKEGDEVNFITAEDIKIGNYTIIKEGSRATGIISELISRGRVGKAGKIAINLDYVKTVNGNKVPLIGVINKKGEDKLFLSLGVTLILPIMPVGLLIRGTEATIPAGYIIQARTDKDTLVFIENNIPYNINFIK